MAIARLSVGIGSKGKASPHAQYIAREGKYAKPSNHQEKLENKGHGNMPKWAEHNPNYFWQMADEHERKNGSTYREHVIALPRELNQTQRHELIQDWIAQEIGDKHAYQYAIHNPPAMDGGEQPHAHIMFSERTLDGIERDPDQYFKRYNSKNPEKGGAKKANTGMKPADRKADLLAQRDRWEQTCNKHLAQAGRYERISMKSLKDQGIDQKPLNLTMAQLKKPEVMAAYQAVLTAQEKDWTAFTWIVMEFDGDDLELEINRQLAQRQQALALETNSINTEKQKEKRHEQEQSKPTAAATATGNAKLNDRLAQGRSRGRDQNERGRGIQKPSSVKSHELGQGHSSQNRAAPTTDQSTDLRSSGLSIEQKRQILKRFNQKIDEIALQLHQHDLKELRDRAKPLLKEINNFRDDKPLNPFKTKAWQQELDKKLNHYSKIKTEHDTKKASGVTKDQKSSAYDIYYHNRPEAYQEIRDISLEIQEFDRQQVLEQQQQPVRISSRIKKINADIER